MAADGTHCGDKKWCYKGKCVKNDNAPVAANGNKLLLILFQFSILQLIFIQNIILEKCVYGDYKWKISGNYGSILCSRVATTAKSQCYYHQYQVGCCETCGKLHTPGRNSVSNFKNI